MFKGSFHNCSRFFSGHFSPPKASTFKDDFGPVKCRARLSIKILLKAYSFVELIPKSVCKREVPKLFIKDGVAWMIVGHGSFAKLWYNRSGCFFTEGGIMRSLAPVENAVNISTTNGSKVEGADWNTTSFEDTLNSSLETHQFCFSSSDINQMSKICRPEVNYVWNYSFVRH